VVAAGTPADVRRRLHRRALDSLPSEAAPWLFAHHAERAGEVRRAYRYYMAAGIDAVRRFDDRAASLWYGRAAAMARELDSRGVPAAAAELVDALLPLAEVLRLGGELRLAGGVLDEVEAQVQTDRQHALSERARGLLALIGGDHAEAVVRLEGAARAARRAGDSESACQIYLDLAYALERSARPADAIAALVQAIDHLTVGNGFAAATGPERLWRVGLALAEKYAAAGQWAEARQTAGQVLSFARQGGWPHARGRLYAVLADLSEQSGDAALALRYRASAIEEMQVLGDRRTTAELLLAAARTAQLNREDARRSADTSRPPAVDWTADPSETMRMAGRLAAEVGWREGVELSRNGVHRDNE